MANIKDVAARAGVSISTVSRALNGKVVVDPLTKKRVLEAVRELNYQPNTLAKGLKEGRTKTIGLILHDIRNLGFPAAIRGVTDVAKKHGYTIILSVTDGDLEAEKLYVENLRKRLVDGLIFLTATKSSTHIPELKKQGYPVVLMIRQLNEEIDTVIVDNFLGGYQATQFLINRGYSRIGIVNGDMDLDLYQQRFLGYQKALQDAAISPDELLCVHNIEGWEDAYQAVMEHRERVVELDAIFGTSDPKALGVIKALKELGLKVPEDIAVIGYDNLDMSELTDPPLTTMAQPFYEIGVKAAERLVKVINSKRKIKPITEKLEAKLLIRGTVGYGKAYIDNNV